MLPWTPYGRRQLALGVPLASQTLNQVDAQEVSDGRKIQSPLSFGFKNLKAVAKSSHETYMF